MEDTKEIKLRKELYWVYLNILEGFGRWDIQRIKERLSELRWKKEVGE